MHNPAPPTHATAHFRPVHEPRPARYSASRHRDRARQGNHRSWEPASPPVPGFGRVQATLAREGQFVRHFENLTKKVNCLVFYFVRYFNALPALESTGTRSTIPSAISPKYRPSATTSAATATRDLDGSQFSGIDTVKPPPLSA